MPSARWWRSQNPTAEKAPGATLVSKDGLLATDVITIHLILSGRTA